MTIEEALELIKINVAEIIHDEKEECDDCVLFGTYKNEQIDMYDNGDNFVIGLGIGQKNYRVYKNSRKVEEFKIIIA